MARVIEIQKVVDGQEGDLRVWWIRNIPGQPEYHLVSDPESAHYTIEALAGNDLHDDEVESNAGGLEVYKDGEWEQWYDEEGRDIDDWWEAPNA